MLFLRISHEKPYHIRNDKLVLLYIEASLSSIFSGEKNFRFIMKEEVIFLIY